MVLVADLGSPSLSVSNGSQTKAKMTLNVRQEREIIIAVV